MPDGLEQSMEVNAAQQLRHLVGGKAAVLSDAGAVQLPNGVLQ